MEKLRIPIRRVLASPYARLARLDKPVGTYLLMWPGYWSIALASSTAIPDPTLLAKFGVGALVMRSAGCTINDILDRKFDAQVARTKTRPLASGEVSLKHAIGFLGAQLSVGLGILLTLPEYAIYWGAISIVPVCLYPLAKRVFDWPQVVLGLTFNWGAILGWAAYHSAIDWEVIMPLYVGCAAWTLGYDTIYAHQDKADDKNLGLHSSALTVGDDATRIFLACMYTFSTTCIFGAGAKYSAIYGGFDMNAFSLGVAVMAGNLGYQVYDLKLDNPDDLGNKFRINHWIGPTLFSAIIMSKLM
jgi:4-hydroxybenzoate polyprenyltransferase